MPFRSEAQRRLLWAKHPGVAKKWAAEYGTPGNLPEHVGKKMSHRLRRKKKKGKS
jgi:hypothetical protein